MDGWRAAWTIVGASALALLAGACDSPSRTLVVDLRTDLVPLEEFVSFRVTHQDQVVERGVLADEPFTVGVRAATFGVDRSPAEVRGQLLDAEGRVVVERPLGVALVGPRTAATILLTRECQGVGCPGDQACVGGRCGAATCSPEAPELCPPGGCMGDADCSAPACVEASCVASACLRRPRDRACRLDQRCDLTDGCVDRMPMVDAGPMDAGTDAGTDAFVDDGLMACRRTSSSDCGTSTLTIGFGGSRQTLSTVDTTDQWDLSCGLAGAPDHAIEFLVMRDTRVRFAYDGPGDVAFSVRENDCTGAERSCGTAPLEVDVVDGERIVLIAEFLHPDRCGSGMLDVSIVE